MNPAAASEVSDWRSLVPAGRVLANELIRAGYTFGAYYPGSPIVDLAEELTRTAKRAPAFGFRYATNEKLAFEMATAVALAGGRAFALMKHVGVNVAFDSAMAVAYTGHHGALLLIVGDDPACESSSTVQDSRLVAKLLGVPCVEPASLKELGAAVALATELSTKLEVLVVLRITTALADSSALLRDEAPDETRRPALEAPRCERRFVVVPANTRDNRVHALRRLETARTLGEGPEFWREEGPAAGSVGLVVQNAAYPAVSRCLHRLGESQALWRTLMPWPLSERAILPFLERHPRIVVVESLDPVLEEQILRIVHRRRLATEVVGADVFPRDFELDEERLLPGLALALGRATPEPPPPAHGLELWSRGPTFCAGCPHTASLHAVQSLFAALPERPFVSSDIGCYTLGAKKGIDIGDAALAMGSSIGVATGMALQGLPTIALIGDSTFLHAGLPALQNAVAQGVDLLVCLLDNGVAAMTGGQRTVAEGSASRLHAAALGLGAASVTVQDPFETAGARALLQRRFGAPGVHVVIFRSPCALTVPPKPRRPAVDLQACTGCGVCVTAIHCPAISLSDAGKFQVDVHTCVGCGFCSEICPERALTPLSYAEPA